MKYQACLVERLFGVDNPTRNSLNNLFPVNATLKNNYRRQPFPAFCTLSGVNYVLFLQSWAQKGARNHTTVSPNRLIALRHTWICFQRTHVAN